MSRGRAASAVVALLIVLAGATSARASDFLDPRLHFRTIDTEHFLIHFHAGKEVQAARLAAIAEDVWSRVGRALSITAPGRTHVMLVDQSEAANGWATPLPYNTIYVTAAAPAGHEFLGNDSDWLRLVFTHEFTHIVHLDRSGGWARLFRGAFGRTPIAFPNLWLPRWQIEGLAVWEESQLTSEGRIFAGDFRAIERLPDTMLPLDQANGGLTRWPGGLAPYAYGSGFHSFLAEQQGDASLAVLAEETARRLPFLGSPAFKKVYGKSLGTLWREYGTYLDGVRSRPRGRGQIEPRQVTHLGYAISAPRFLPPSCESCPQEIAFSHRGPDEFPALYSVPATPPDGTPSLPRRLTTRYLGTTIGIDRNIVVFDQQEVRRNSGLYSDLLVLERSSGRTRVLVREGRLQEPDLSPDGRAIAAVRETSDGRELVILRLSESLRAAGGYEGATVTATSVIAPAQGTLFNTPRWSPDGTLLVAARQQLGTTSALVLVEPASGTVQPLAALAAARIVTPTWTPDGRSVVASLALSGETFDLYQFDAVGSEPPRRLTVTSGGAMWPDVSSDGRQLTFAGQTAAGFDVFVMPFDLSQAVAPPFPASPALPTSPAPPALPALQVTAFPPAPASRDYDPLATLLPRSWFPLIETADSQTRIGASVAGNDVLRRHLYTVSATWLVQHPGGSTTPAAATPDWEATYVYDRWRPAFFLSGSSDTLFAAGPSVGGRPSNITVREREFQAGLLLAAQHVRVTHRALISGVAASDRVVGPGRFANGDRVAFRLGGSTMTAHTFARSISPERGMAVGATVELAREALGASDAATTSTGDFRAYLPAFGRHDVLALRVGGGTTSGPPGVRRTFVMGGLDNVGDVINFSRDAFGLLRGFPVNTFAGSHVALVNADYRLPLARPERGIGTWPILLRSLHATAFADAGHAWSDSFHTRDIKTSLGGELVLDLVAGYSLPVSVAIGAAVGHDRATGREHSLVYGRFSRTF